MRFQMRWIGLLAVVLTALAVVGAALADDPNKSGGTNPITLTFADQNTSLAVDFPAAQRFVDRVEAISGGKLKIKVIEGYKDADVPPYDPAGNIVPDLKSGKVDLGIVRAASLDTVGIHSLDALFAPMLVDSYAVQRAVVSGPIGRDMLDGVESEGLVAVTLLDQGIARPWGKRGFVRGPAWFKGQKVLALPTSKAHARIVTALGGTPTTQPLDPWSVLLTNVHDYVTNDRVAPYLLTNVSLYPRTLIILGSPARFAKLSDEQRGWIARAAAEAEKFSQGSSGAAALDQADLDQACKFGQLKAAEATAAELASYRAATAPVLAQLEQDTATKARIDQILALKAGTRSERLVIPRGCRAKPTPAPPSKKAFPARGVFRYTLSKAEILRITPGMDDAHMKETVGTYTWTFSPGRLSLVQTGCDCSYASSHWKGRYTLAGDRFNVTWLMDKKLCGTQCRQTARWTYDGKALRFFALTSDPYDIVNWGAGKPWVRIR